jgi:lysophospholipase L1-like esterase
MLVRFRQDVVNLKPKAVVILAGINDIAGNTGPSTLDMIFHNIQSMAEIAQANDIKVIISSILPAYDFPWRPGMKPAPKVVALNKMLKKYCQKQDFVYLDYFTPMADKKNALKNDLGDDGVHPNLAGYQIMAPLAQAAIAKVLE